MPYLPEHPGAYFSAGGLLHFHEGDEKDYFHLHLYFHELLSWILCCLLEKNGHERLYSFPYVDGLLPSLNFSFFGLVLAGFYQLLKRKGDVRKCQWCISLSQAFFF